MARWVAAVGCLAVLGCSTSKVRTVTPAPAGGPSAVVAAFMQAVADSNLAQMGHLWGTVRGPAAVTNNPRNWPQRVTVIHAYLKGGTARVLGESNPAVTGGDRRDVTVELRRGGCVKTVPFSLIRARDGSWLVNSIDLNAAGVPGRPCDPATATPPAPRQLMR